MFQLLFHWFLGTAIVFFFLLSVWFLFQSLSREQLINFLRILLFYLLSSHFYSNSKIFFISLRLISFPIISTSIKPFSYIPSSQFTFPIISTSAIFTSFLVAFLQFTLQSFLLLQYSLLFPLSCLTSPFPFFLFPFL